ncbi:MAG: hypothetical protein KAI45_11320, partial [Melioribacteraceae bacterium]|nr:hypothetical protein [Melioribacteraceae bacterium]
MSKAETQIKNIKSKLRKLNNKEDLIKTIIGLNLIVVMILLLNILLSFLELSGVNSIEERTILFYVGIILALVGVIYFIGIPIVKGLHFLNSPNYKKLSEKVGLYYSEINDSLINAIELSEEKNDLYSKVLASAAIDIVHKKTENVDFKKATSFNKTKNHFLFSALTIIFAVLLFSTVPNLRSASYRIINHKSEFKIPQKFRFYIEPGN